MDNQLDLNENETEYYENMIQKLCEDLEKLGDEKVRTNKWHIRCWYLFLTFGTVV